MCNIYILIGTYTYTFTHTHTHENRLQYLRLLQRKIKAHVLTSSGQCFRLWTELSPPLFTGMDYYVALHFMTLLEDETN